MNSAAPGVNADEIWQQDAMGRRCTSSGSDCLTGKGVIIAIIDSGVDYTHSDFGGCTKEQFLNKECDKVIDGYDFLNNDDDPMDDGGHGTHVAGIAAGNGVLKGIAPDAKIVSYKVLDSKGSGSLDNVLSAMERTADPNDDGDFSDHYDILA